LLLSFGQAKESKKKECLFLFSFVIWISALIYLSFDHLDFEFEQAEPIITIIED